MALGDRDVQIRMTQIGRNEESHPPRWLKDDVTDNSQRGSLVYRIAHGIQSDDVAVYGCFRNQLRDQAKHGIQILIVRGKERLSYRLSSVFEIKLIIICM